MMASSKKKLAMEKRRIVFRFFEYLLVFAIIAFIWMVMFLPVAMYYLGQPQSSLLEAPNTTEALTATGETAGSGAMPLSTSSDGPLQPSTVEQPDDVPRERQNTTSTKMESCPNAMDAATDLLCREGFFYEPVNGGQCRPSCRSWSMFGKAAQLASATIIGMATVIGILTTIVVIVLSCTRFKRMLEFPSVLILYQDVIMSVHGISVLIGLCNRGLYCTSEDLLESYESPSPYCMISGIISSYLVYPLTFWICIQVGYILLGICKPFYIEQLNNKKRTRHFLHFTSVLVGVLGLAIPTSTTLILGGYSAVDTTYPPPVCWAKDRQHTVYTLLIPMGLMLSIINTMLVFILRFLVRNRCISKSSSMELKQAEVKVLIICCSYVILGLATLLGYSMSSAVLGELQHELKEYIACERCGVNSDVVCDRSGFERFTNPTLITVAYGLLALYPVITLVYVLRIQRRKPHSKQSQVQQDVTSSF